MDIAYLLWLQELRQALPAFVDEFFLAVSAIAISSALVAIPCILYWCLDKRAGQFMVISFSLGTFCNQLIKNTFCCYRPWIRETTLRPVEAALRDATGYSFPSGHTQSSAGLIGAMGWYYRKRHKVLAILCWVFVGLVAFSRNYLGVHTPQDVIVALLEAVAILFVTERLVAWVDAREGRDLRVCVVILLCVAAYLAYIVLKPYPLDFDAAGNVLVEPLAMQVDCFKSAGVMAGFALGWFLERRLLSFEVNPQAGWRRIATRFAIGMIVVVVLHLAARPLLALGIDERWYELIKNFLTILGASFVAPAAFCAVERHLSWGEETKTCGQER